MLYVLRLHGGSRDGEESFALRPYFELTIETGETYLAELLNGEPPLEWLADDKRAIDLTFVP